jgi:hypothetical protein
MSGNLEFKDKYRVVYNMNYICVCRELNNVINGLKNKDSELEQNSIYKMNNLFYEKEWFSYLDYTKCSNNTNYTLDIDNVDFENEIIKEFENALTPNKTKIEVRILREKRALEIENLNKRDKFSKRQRHVPHWLAPFPKEQCQINTMLTPRYKPKWLLDRPGLAKPYVQVI